MGAQSWLDSSKTYDHGTEAAEVGRLDPGWHVWDATSEGRPAILDHGWNGILAELDGDVTQTAGWMDYLLAADYERSVLIAGVDGDGVPRAAAVGFMRVPRWPLGAFRVMRFPAYPSVGGDSGILAAALDACERLARARGCMTIEFVGVGQPDAVASMKPAGYSVRERIEYVLDLSRGEEELWAGLRRRHRRNVRVSGRRNVRVARSDSVESLHALRALQVEVTRRHAAKGDPFGLRSSADYDELYKHVIRRGLGRIYCAYVDDDLASAALYLTFGRRCRGFYGGSNQLGLQTRAALAVNWEAIAQLSREGFAQLSLGTSHPKVVDEGPESPEYGLHEFKLGFGAEARYATASATKQLRPIALRVHRTIQRLRSCMSTGRRSSAVQHTKAGA